MKQNNKESHIPLLSNIRYLAWMRAERRLCAAIRQLRSRYQALRRERADTISSSISAATAQSLRILRMSRRVRRGEVCLFPDITYFHTLSKRRYPARPRDVYVNFCATQLKGVVGEASRLELDTWWLECCLVSVWNHTVGSIANIRQEEVCPSRQ